MPTITGTTQLLGVIGYPVKHSLSPVMHNAAIAEMGVDFVYLPWPIAPSDLSTALAGFAAIGVRGFSITIPHKQAIIPLLSEISPVAQAVGAVNTVWRTPTGWAGTNTDVEGFLAPLQRCDRPWNQTLAVILGAGGAARAVVAGLAQLGCAKICVVGRNFEKLQAFQTSWQDSPWTLNLSVHDGSELPQLLPQAGLLVNSTPVGMYPEVAQSPVTPDLLATLPQGAIAYDLIYTPSPTEFLRQAQAVGAVAIDGSEMLVRQGAAALQIWLDRPVPVDIMGQALRQHLQG
ncbi:shikimate dehydrogenase [Laspinema sp. A4]|uniref:shikimate dehydrogenase n=1 Tax=Laspinema sp. D2d TaxID=2953686 RepID=UPI0021BA5C5C|nr:shikimate dehydrogenase [Laspinema sp. D2d]MCT7985381.1 shikimate dehydrogenase [Laspinema sp. D2d]